MLRRRVAAAFAGTILVGAGIGWAAQADAQPHSDPAPFDWDLYVGVITGQSPVNTSVATSWQDLMVPPSLREAGVS